MAVEGGVAVERQGRHTGRRLPLAYPCLTSSSGHPSHCRPSHNAELTVFLPFGYLGTLKTTNYQTLNPGCFAAPSCRQGAASAAGCGAYSG